MVSFIISPSSVIQLNFSINPHHAEIPPNNIQHISDIISQLRKKFNQKLHIVPGMTNSKQKASMEVIPPLTQKFADIYYYRCKSYYTLEHVTMVYVVRKNYKII